MHLISVAPGKSSIIRSNKSGCLTMSSVSTSETISGGTMGSFNLFRPYHYGPHKWDDYLLDIQDALTAKTDLQRESISLSRLSLQHTAQTNEELQAITQELADVRQGIEAGF